MGNNWDNVLQLDHPIALRDHGDDDQGLTPYCAQRRSRKSYLEALTPFQENPLASVFEPSVYDAFVSSPKPRQAVKQLHMPKTNNVTGIDARKRRRSALEQNKLPIPIVSPLDDIKPRTKMKLGAYSYIYPR